MMHRRLPRAVANLILAASLTTWHLAHALDFVVLQVHAPFLDCASNFQCATKMKCQTDMHHQEYFPVGQCVPEDDGEERSMKIIVNPEGGATFGPGETAKAYRYSDHDCDPTKLVSTTDMEIGVCSHTPIGTIGTGYAVKWVSTYKKGDARVEGAAVMWFPGSTNCEKSTLTAWNAAGTAKVSTPWPFKIMVFPRDRCLLDLSEGSLGTMLPDRDKKINHIFYRQSMKWHCNGDKEVQIQTYSMGREAPGAWRNPSHDDITEKLPRLCWAAPERTVKFTQTCQEFHYKRDAASEAAHAHGGNSMKLAMIFNQNSGIDKFGSPVTTTTSHPFGCGTPVCNWKGCDMVASELGLKAAVGRTHHIGIFPACVMLATALVVLVMQH